MAAHDGAVEAGSYDGRNVAALDRSAAAVATKRFGISGGVDAGGDSRAAEAGGERGASGRRRGGHEGRVWPQPADPAGSLRSRAADCLRERGEFVARTRRGAPGPSGGTHGGGRDAAPDYCAGAYGERFAGRRWRDSRFAGGDWRGEAIAYAGVSKRAFFTYKHQAIAAGPGVCVCDGAGDGGYFWRGAGLVCRADRSCGRIARIGTWDERSLLDGAKGAVVGASSSLGGASRLRDDAGTEL